MLDIHVPTGLPPQQRPGLVPEKHDLATAPCSTGQGVQGVLGALPTRPARIEEMPNELHLEVFSYLKPAEACAAFSELNCRFTNLLENEVAPVARVEKTVRGLKSAPSVREVAQCIRQLTLFPASHPQGLRRALAALVQSLPQLPEYPRIAALRTILHNFKSEFERSSECRQQALLVIASLKLTDESPEAHQQGLYEVLSQLEAMHGFEQDRIFVYFRQLGLRYPNLVLSVPAELLPLAPKETEKDREAALMNYLAALSGLALDLVDALQKRNFGTRPYLPGGTRANLTVARQILSPYFAKLPLPQREQLLAMLLKQMTRVPGEKGEVAMELLLSLMAYLPGEALECFRPRIEALARRWPGGLERWRQFLIDGPALNA